MARLCDVDLVAEKLLANDDRYLDDSALGRDLVDLLVLERHLGALPAAALAKAHEAYGPSVLRAHAVAQRRFRDRPNLLARSLEALSVLPSERAYVTARITALAPDDGSP